MGLEITGFNKRDLTASAANAVRNAVRVQLQDAGWNENQIEDALSKLSDEDLINAEEIEFSLPEDEEN